MSDSVPPPARRTDLPTYLQRAVLPGNVSPGVRPQRALVGRSNRLPYELDVVREAIQHTLGRSAIQTRSASSQGIKRSGSPALLSTLGAPPAATSGLSSASAEAVGVAAGRSLSSLSKHSRYTPAPDDQHAGALAPAHTQLPTVEERHRREAVPADSLQLTQGPEGSVPRRHAPLPDGLRRQLYAGTPTPSANRAVVGYPARSSSPADLTRAAVGIRRFQEFDAPVTPAQVQQLSTAQVRLGRKRHEVTDYHSTAPITAAPAGVSMHATATEQYDATSRGLGIGRLGHADKAHRAARSDAHASRIRDRDQHMTQFAETTMRQRELRDESNVRGIAALRERHHTVLRDARAHSERIAAGRFSTAFSGHGMAA